MHTTEGLVSKPCAGSVETVWNRLLETLKILNVPLFATVDHAANARTAGLFMPETRVAFFRKPGRDASDAGAPRGCPRAACAS